MNSTSLLLLVASFCPAQTQKPRFEHLSVDDGLAQAAVYAIFQDRQGFMWFGTQDGLNRFDGYTFEVHKHVQFDTSSIIDNNIRVIQQDHAGDLWIGTTNGLSRFNPSTQTFTSYQQDTTNEASLSDNHIQTIYEDREHRLWIGTGSGGLNLFRHDTDDFEHFQHDDNQPRSLSHNRVRDVLEDADGGLWLATLGGGLNLFTPENNRFQHIRKGTSNDTGLASDFVMCLFRDPIELNKIWIGTYGGGLNWINTRTRKVTRLSRVEAVGLGDNRIFDICADPSGAIWIGTFAGGLSLYDATNHAITRYVSNPLVSESLSADFVRTLYLDHSNNLWVGTNMGGVNRLDTKPPKFTRYQFTPDATGGLRNKFANAICSTQDGTVWVGTNDGLDRLPEDANTFSPVELPAVPPNPFVSALAYTEQDNALWVGMFGDGLVKWDPSSSAVLTTIKKHSVPKGLLDNRITVMLAGKDGSLWVGTTAGLNRLNLADNTMTSFTNDPHDAETLSHNAVQSLLLDRYGTLWVGTNGGGLNRLAADTGKFQRYLHTGDPATGPSHNSVNALMEDEIGNLWIGTNNGLSCLRRDGRFESYFEKDGIANDHICGILDDELGNLWLSRPDGISRFNPNLPVQEQFRNYGRSDGLQGQSFLAKAAHRSEAGQLFFGGTKGVVRFDPLRVQDNPYSPDVVLTSFKIFGKPTELDTAISTIKQIRLRHDQHFFSFEFAALDFTQPTKNSYAYRMEGLDEEWVEAGTRRYANYTHVPPGSYRFRVRAANNDGVWNDTGASVRILIAAPFWQRWWFRLSCMVAIVSLLLLAHRIRVTKLLEVERTRNRIAQDLHDNVGATLSSIAYFAQAIKSEPAAEAQPVVRKFLGLITEGATEAQEAIADIIWSIDPSNDQWDKLMAKVRRYASDVFESQALDYQIDLPRNLPGRIDMERRRNIWLIVKEILNNIARHSGCSKAEIKLTANEKQLHLLVADNGQGFNPEASISGNGLRNIRSRAEALKASLSLESQPGKGTRWHLVFPV